MTDPEQKLLQLLAVERYESIDLLAKLSGLSIKHTVEALQGLVDQGYISQDANPYLFTQGDN
jgi:DNA-binding IclR family transcriptional regulator